jgi:hypothetical protein
MISGGRGRRFKSSHSDHKINKLNAYRHSCRRLRQPHGNLGVGKPHLARTYAGAANARKTTGAAREKASGRGAAIFADLTVTSPPSQKILLKRRKGKR